MVQGKYKRRSTTILSAEKKTPKSRSLVLKKCFLSGAAAVLIVAVGLWIRYSVFDHGVCPAQKSAIAIPV